MLKSVRTCYIVRECRVVIAALPVSSIDSPAPTCALLAEKKQFLKVIRPNDDMPPPLSPAAEFDVKLQLSKASVPSAST
jgi:hypothetical protein